MWITSAKRLSMSLLVRWFSCSSHMYSQVNFILCGHESFVLCFWLHGLWITLFDIFLSQRRKTCEFIHFYWIFNAYQGADFLNLVLSAVSGFKRNFRNFNFSGFSWETLMSEIVTRATRWRYTSIAILSPMRQVPHSSALHSLTNSIGQPRALAKLPLIYEVHRTRPLARDLHTPHRHLSAKLGAKTIFTRVNCYCFLILF